MSNIGKEISILLDKSSASASDITKPLKKIGDGNMLNGVKKLYSFAWGEGSRKGMIKGSIGTLGVLGAVYLVHKGFKHLKGNYEAKKIHDEMGEKIYKSFQEETASTLDADSLDEIIESNNLKEDTYHEDTV